MLLRETLIVCSKTKTCPSEIIAMQSNLRIAILVLLCSLFLLTCECVLTQAQADGFIGDPLLLKFVADQNEQNVRAIQCWQGTVEVVEKSQSKDGTKTKWRRHVHFAYDQERQAWLWSNEWLEYGHRRDLHEIRRQKGSVAPNSASP
jgi:hypothetical protein